MSFRSPPLTASFFFHKERHLVPGVAAANLFFPFLFLPFRRTFPVGARAGRIVLLFLRLFFLLLFQAMRPALALP